MNGLSHCFEEMGKHEELHQYKIMLHSSGRADVEVDEQRSLKIWEQRKNNCQTENYIDSKMSAKGELL